MKKIIFLSIAIVFISAFGITESYSQQMGPSMMGRGYGMGPGMMQGGWNRMSLEQQKEWRRLEIAFWKDTLQLRQSLASKQMELWTLWEEENPDPEKAKALSDEISKLRSRLNNKQNDFLIQCREKFGDRGWACPGGGYGMGPDMMGQGYGMGFGMMGRGYGMGPGMMHGGWGMGPGMRWGRGMDPAYGQYGPGYPGSRYQQPQKPIETDDAKKMLENYLESIGNPNLKLGKIKGKGEAFEAEILTKDGSLVDKIIVDKGTGWMRSAY